ncbi:MULTISPECIES: MmcQ/YjbR family DNA-binding protein [unclassified Caulobacter]|uniref:MmcQ/YjbR family DNA-binding protein n=1 Tax=unclassified Caulobacter TaxID=2648921 RepID=UPI000D3B7E87|nr:MULTISPECIES: hypothetical protein [unclassified Caulobacter]PTS83192.1 hypothetical protein DBR21_16735 [Caulobacter sp. HMWF009]PTT05686.1 hypothetical protein DBR10_14755 [Caulobacter sp. HMWF025]PTT77267.1 hypothetical protein DBR41_24400 [Pseudomonas sp. HMWF010]
MALPDWFLAFSQERPQHITVRATSATMHQAVVLAMLGFMSTPSDLERIASNLPGVTGEGISFSIGKKALCWAYLARTHAKGRREPVHGVVAVACEIAVKEMLIEAMPALYFDDDHYRGYPAVLIRLDEMDNAELETRLEEAWRLRAPARLRQSAFG